MPYAIPLLKYKLRQLRRLEKTIRSKNRQPAGVDQKLVWEVFFSTKPANNDVKYPLTRLMAMNEVEYKYVIEEFFFRVYFQSFKENGLPISDVYDPQLLELINLPPYAGLQDIKKRFRELAMCYHPDRGGDSDKFIELMEIYEQITGDRK
jgi:hypothetical protein